jgi:phosphatidate phosphatase
VVGAGVNVVFTDVGKYAAGRLRPNFFAVCNPDFSKLNCTTGFHKNFITNYECTGDELLVKDARLSFPSGHSSFSGIPNFLLV